MRFTTYCVSSITDMLSLFYTINCYTIEKCRLNPVDDDGILMQLKCRIGLIELLL